MTSGYGFDGPPSNGLGFSGGAPLDRQGTRAGSEFQNGRDLVGAQRRPLQARVGRTRRLAFSNAIWAGSRSCTLIELIDISKVVSCLSNRPVREVGFDRRRIQAIILKCIEWKPRDTELPLVWVGACASSILL